MNVSDQNNLEVFLLGAGCSHASGYPLAAGMKDGLRAFSERIRGSSPIVSTWCQETVQLLEEYHINTLDELANRLLSGALRSEKNDEGDYWNRAYEIINKAKAAVSSYFLHLETGTPDLSSYKDFIDEHIPETGSRTEPFPQSNIRVLSFNYDRLFELAFANRFQDRLITDDQMLHGPNWMNSGIVFGADNPKIDLDRFSFLKLHGSVGITMQGLFPESTNEMEFKALGLNSFTGNVCWDSVFVRKDPISPGKTRPHGSTICFPIEKKTVLQSIEKHTLLAYDRRAFIGSAWNAADYFTTRAYRITICGFSGRGKDLAYLQRLIQNAKGVNQIRIFDPDANSIAERIVGFSPEIESKIRAKSFSFWLKDSNPQNKAPALVEDRGTFNRPIPA